MSASPSSVDSPGVDSPGVDSPGVDSSGVDSSGVDSSGVDSPGVRKTWKQAVATGCLLLALLLFVSIDGRRPWHALQVEYRGLQAESLRLALEAEEQRLAPELDILRREVTSQEKAWEAQQHEVHELRSQRRALDVKRSLAQQRARASSRVFEEAARHSEVESPELRELRQATDLDRREVEELTHQVEDRQAKIDALRADLTAAEEAFGHARQPLESLGQQLRETLLPSWADWPLLTPWVSSLRVMEQHPEVLAAAPQPTVERCTTCHLGVLDDAAPSASRRLVLRAHPRPDLYLQPESPHPLQTFGCRVCHGGDGRSVGGRRTQSRGEEGDPHQGLLPEPLLATACRACHDGVEDGSVQPGSGGSGPESSGSGEIGAAQSLSQGQGEWELLGCANCHGENTLERSAPDLSGLAGKTSQGWVYAWLLDPSVGHPKVSSKGQQRAQAEAWAISESLWHRARPTNHPDPPRADGEVGAVLFETLGCRSCHPLQNEDGIGPSLESGNRPLDPGWTYAWLLEPRRIDPETTMPHLRLSEEEAAALTAFLIRGGAAVSRESEYPEVDPSVRDRLLLDTLGESMTLRQAQARVDGLGDRQRTLALGDHLLVSRGCFACHRGGEAPNTFAGKLQGLGLVSGPRLAESHLPELADTLADLLGEDSVTAGAVPGPGPRYELPEETARGLLVAVLDPPAPVSERHQTAPSAVIERGEMLVTRYGCRGCHRLGGRGGEAFAAGDPLQRPPGLDGIGRRLRADWLQAYLADPSRVTVRPWLKARMPTYGLTSDEILDLVAFFLARDGASALHPPPEAPRRQDLTVGSLLFEALQCDRCHFATEDSGGFVLEALAPDYQLASQRLRPDWTVQWLLDPQGERPRTTMPSFLGDAAEKDLGYLQRTFDSPLFLIHRQRLRRQFNDLESMDAYLMDRQRVATALRDHVWSLGETSEMR